MKTVGFCTVFIADMNSACKITILSVYLLNFHRMNELIMIFRHKAKHWGNEGHSALKTNLKRTR